MSRWFDRDLLRCLESQEKKCSSNVTNWFCVSVFLLCVVLLFTPLPWLSLSAFSEPEHQPENRALGLPEFFLVRCALGMCVAFWIPHYKQGFIKALGTQTILPLSPVFFSGFWYLYHLSQLQSFSSWQRLGNFQC